MQTELKNPLFKVIIPSLELVSKSFLVIAGSKVLKVIAKNMLPKVKA